MKFTKVLTAAAAMLALASSAQAADDTIKVGILHSLSGTMAISEATLKDAMLMLIADQNKKGGLLGKKLEPVVVDPASDWPLFAEKARQLISQNKVAAIFGCWTSVSRKSVLPVIEELNSLLFYPVQFEGEESSRNVFYTGAAPNTQAIPAVDYLMNQEKVKRWVLAGTDYVYPRTTNKILEAYLKSKGVKDEDILINYTPFGQSDWQTIVASIKAFGSAGKKTAVVSTINGDADVFPRRPPDRDRPHRQCSADALSAAHGFSLRYHQHAACLRAGLSVRRRVAGQGCHADGDALMADNQDESLFGQTPWQTVGPFFHYGLPWKGGADLIGQSDLGARPELFPEDHYVLNLSPPRAPVKGTAIEIRGLVLDGENAPIPDALVEIWQANAAGRYRSPDDRREDIALDEGFVGFGRAATSADGEYHFRTILPGRVPGPGNSLQAAHIAIGVMGRGLIRRQVTRLYFEGGAGLTEDPVLALVPVERRDTLIARKAPGGYRFDIVLQGARETVFFDC